MNRDHESAGPLTGTRNGRDLGGIRVAGGKSRIAANRLLRSECLPLSAGSQESDTSGTRALGLRTIIDLRTDVEVGTTPSAWPTLTGAVRCRIPIDEGATGSKTYLLGGILEGRIRRYDDEDLGRLYVETVERRASSIGEVVTALAEPNGLPGLIHCTHGKDRTGIVVAVLLSALGACVEDIIADYVRTGVNMPDLITPVTGVIRDAGVDPDDVGAMFEAPERAIRMLLDHLDETYGGARFYLVERAGVTPASLRRLEELLTEPAGAPASGGVAE
jgi:protein-tyrosine phosphatase